MTKKLLNVLLLNIFTASGLCIVAQLLRISSGMTDSFDFIGFLINFCVAYPSACLIGYFVPAPALGVTVARIFHIQKGIEMAIIMTLCINIVFTVLMSVVMTGLNVVILAHQGAAAFVGGYISNFIPMYLASCIVSWFAVPPIEKLANRFGSGD